jgi:hypothetical protein
MVTDRDGNRITLGDFVRPCDAETPIRSLRVVGLLRASRSGPPIDDASWQVHTEDSSGYRRWWWRDEIQKAKEPRE